MQKEAVPEEVQKNQQEIDSAVIVKLEEDEAEGAELESVDDEGTEVSRRYLGCVWRQVIFMHYSSWLSVTTGF